MENGKPPSSEITADAVDENLYNLSFFQKDFVKYRKQLIGLLLLPLIYTSLLMWGCVSLYFGSLISNNNLSKLTVYAVDLDGGFLGEQILAGVKMSQMTPGGLNWQFDTAINETSLSQEVVLNERAWAVLQSPLPPSPILQMSELTGSNHQSHPTPPPASTTLSLSAKQRTPRSPHSRSSSPPPATKSPSTPKSSPPFSPLSTRL